LIFNLYYDIIIIYKKKGYEMDDLKREFEEELKRDYEHEVMMRSSWDYAIAHLNFNETMTLAEFRDAIEKLNEYGWSMEDEDIIELFRELVY
jgi:NADH/NAD ratio-sensing transcriptional regulator Rex